ncbi:MAG: hypothetical protein ACO1O1_15755 [Adhaeribacter sp.]
MGLATQAAAQKQTSIWYFGLRAGLDFSQGAPAALTDGMMSTNEGCASIADSEGRLLFYTNGVYVWNRQHQQMPNGFRLMGHKSSTQSAIIVPNPGNPNQHYIFTTDLQSQAYGLRYNLVDMSLDGGQGDVKEKNVYLISPITEKITAVHHRNQRDIWVIAHLWNSDAFVAYLVTDKGVSKKPVISHIGTAHRGQGKGAIGSMKASPDGTKLAVAIWRNFNRFEVFDFDNYNGNLSNRIALEPFPEAYGVEFSPDGSKLYGTTNGIAGAAAQLWQFNLAAGSRSAISNSAILIPTAGSKLGALQLAPDGKIYLAVEDAEYLGVIQQPNAPGWSCRYVDQGVSLGERKARLGLPNFIQSYFRNLPPPSQGTSSPVLPGQGLSAETGK